ncbi:hypothetical protein DEU31_1663 [Brachybacterium sp. AG952]|nr:hypothetical protein DEU31_1663 [Brachybacterium sp. AG952]
MDGLGRILASETNVSDLLAYFTEEDPSPWVELIGKAPARVIREGRASTAKRADLLLQDESGATVGAVEVKLGHHLSQEQSDWYTTTFEADVPLLLASLDPVDERVELPDPRWSALLLSDLMGRWTGSSVHEVAVLAASVTAILTAWSTQVAAVSTGMGGRAEEPLATISDPFLGRVLTRALVPGVRSEGAEAVYTGVTSGGGNPLLAAWRTFRNRPSEHCVIAEVRWQPEHQNMVLRFGVDVDGTGREAREAAWQLATTLDSAIRADEFAAHLHEIDPERAELLVLAKRSGRPTAKGDWGEIVQKGFERGDGSRYNPGFHRDGDTRFEASLRIDTTRATGPDVVALLGHALAYLREREERA